MTTMKVDRQCAHPGCHCEAPKDNTYCSSYCESTSFETACGCGHPGCRTAVGKQRAKMP